MSLFIPPLFYGFYAVMKYNLNTRIAPSLLISGISIGVLIKAGLYSSNKEMGSYYSELFDKYKDEVVNPKLRGLKLYGSKKAYQVDNKEFTTSNFDDLKQLVYSQIKR